MRSFNSILVANRGEIAVRIVKTARSLSFRTIAVYSEADATAPHAQIADDAALLGPSPIAASYLNIERILKAAQQTGAEAIHPGYGFLSENAEFARACEQAGLVFIGPGADAIELMGNKAEAKRRMIAAGIPCLPGYFDADQSDTTMSSVANEIGCPLMVKAAAGGGGRGMRLVERAEDLPMALTAARSEVLNAFGSHELILEKAILRPRHVEFQIVADNHGNVIHLGERDCSIQRRYQKVVEEAPCPVMTDELRAQMGAAAVEAARSIKYKGVGTIEFLLDEEENFYFLEMNTRLQVEHPVTEMITKLDLVSLQIQIAEGLPLELTQADVAYAGHAIEGRLYAEDPAQAFLPCAGTIDHWRPAKGIGIRIDSGIQTGQEISPFYDPMLAKVIAWGETRELARHRLINALEHTEIFGIITNKSFLSMLLSKEAFAKGKVTTAFIAEELSPEDLANPQPDFESMATAALLQYCIERQCALEECARVSSELLNWSSGGRLLTQYVYFSNGERVELTVSPETREVYQIRGVDSSLSIKLLTFAEGVARLSIDGCRRDVNYSAPSAGVIHISLAGETFRFRNEIAFPASGKRTDGSGHIVAPMHGALFEIFVELGDHVEIGTCLAVLEAMKIQHEILAEIEGTVQAIYVDAGTQVAANELLIEIVPDA